MNRGGNSRGATIARAAALAVLLLAFALAWRLLALRYQAGSSHPPYSSWRADPLGSRVLHDALDRLAGLEVTRLEESAHTLETPSGTALIVLGLDPADTVGMPASLVAGMEAFATAGGRLVIALTPTPRETWASRRAEQRARAAPIAGSGDTLDPEVSARERWGFDLHYEALPTAADGTVLPAHAERGPAAAERRLPESIPCHTGVRFTGLSNAWQTVYAVDTHGVLMSRTWGAGQIYLLADAYPFSNEGLAAARQPELLAWLLDRRRQIVFNETHLGSLRTGGIATLARRYRLHGFLGGTLLVLALVLLRIRRPLVPEAALAADDPAAGSGLGSEAGLAALIQRAIPPGDLPRLAFEEWRDAVGQHHPGWTPRLAQLAELARADANRPVHARDPVRTLAEMTRLVGGSTSAPHHPRAHPLDLPRP